MNQEMPEKTRSMPYEQALMVIGQALKTAAPFTHKNLKDIGERDTDWWADYAHMMLQHKIWSEEIASKIVSYAVANIPMTIDIQDGDILFLLGGVDGKTQKGQELLAKVCKSMEEGKVLYKDQEGNVIKVGKKSKQNKTKRKMVKESRRKNR